MQGYEQKAVSRESDVPVVHHELLHSQQSVVADLLVFMMHVIHYQLFPTELFNHPAKCKRLVEIRQFLSNSFYP